MSNYIRVKNVAPQQVAASNAITIGGVLAPLKVTDNGLYIASANNLDGYSEVNVNVEKGIFPTGTLEITENGEYEVIEKAYVEVNVAGSGGSVEVPPVTDLAVDENYILTFTEPDVSNFVEQGATISYLVSVNNVTFESSTNSVSIIGYLKHGVNSVSVVTKITLTSSEVLISTEMVFAEVVMIIETTLPKVLYSSAAATVDKNVYIFGGTTAEYVNSNTIYKFDTTTETITMLNTVLPTGTKEMGCCSFGNIIYLFGGNNGSTSGSTITTIYKFDTTTETITMLSTTIPTSLSGMGVAIIGSNVYLFGGSSKGTWQTTIYKFDTTTETITTLSATLPTKLGKMGIATVGSNVYLFGGTGGTGGTKPIYKFDTTTETITTLSATLPNGSYGLVASTIETTIYLFGGASNVTTIQKFDTVTEEVIKLSAKLPIGAVYSSIATIGTNAYIFGGRTNTSGDMLDTILKFY